MRTPWVYGPRPNQLLQDNSAFDSTDGVSWDGGQLGFTSGGNTVSGTMNIGRLFASQTQQGYAQIQNWKEYDRYTHPSNDAISKQLGTEPYILRDGEKYFD